VFGRGRRERERLVATVPWWWHSIDVGDGVVTPGRKGAEKPGGPVAFMRAELESLALPDLRGKSVLDIGAFNGYYCFAAEELGAARVVALDWYAWIEEEPGSPPGSMPPGRAGFEVARRLRGSRVEPVLHDFMTMDLDALGRFDVVLFLGVLYHMPDPLGAMRRLAAVTSELAIVESQAIVVAGAEHHALTEFFPGDELNGDPSNWFVPNLAALCALSRAAGFTRAEPVIEPPPPPDPAVSVTEHYRAVVHAFV
jgi:tRNA (mo5U34)-methyltransferase